MRNKHPMKPVPLFHPQSPRSRGALLSLLMLFTFVPLGLGLTITQTKLGNIFYTTETVSFQLTGAAGNTVQWTASDYFGTVVGQGSVTLSGGSATLTPNLGRRGYFDLELVEKNGGNTVDQKNTSFAVLTPIDISTMGDSPFGSQTHFAQSHQTDQLALLARAGIAHHRDEQYWNQIETQVGVYTFPSKFTNYMAASAAQGLRPLITLNWSNQFYDWDEGQFTAPYTDNGRQGYANYAVALLNQYSSQITAFEVWNEYNAGTFIKGPATADKDLYYYRMLKKTFEQVKAVRPDVKILAGGTVPVTHGFLRDVFAHGAMPYLDVVSVHPYRSTPEGVDLEMSELRALIRSYNNNQDKPIWASEFSLSAGNVAEQYTAAPYLVRIATLMLSQNVGRMYYYLNQDDGNFPYRGLISSATSAQGKYAPHPVYVAYANLIRQLYGWTCTGRVAGTASTTYIYKFTKGSSVQHVLWSLAPTSVSASASGNRTCVTLMGEESTLVPSGGVINVALTEDPIYIEGAISGIAEAANPVVADSIAGYSKTQGQNGWYYGYANLGSNDPYAPSNFQQMSWGIWKTDNYRWLGTSEFHYQGIANAQPASAWAIRRWISNVNGVATLSGSVNRTNSNGDGVRFRVFVDGTQVLNQLIAAGGSLSYTIPGVTLQTGTKVDFAVTQNGEGSFDATGLTARVTRTQSPPSSTVYQAESATLSGGVQNLSGNSGYTGSGYADYPTTGGYVEWTVNVPSAGTYTLDFRYANGGGTVRTLTRTINGGGSTVVNFPTTANFSTWSSVTASVTLNAGNNTIRMTGPGSSPGGPNVDKLTVIGPN